MDDVIVLILFNDKVLLNNTILDKLFRLQYRFSLVKRSSLVLHMNEDNYVCVYSLFHIYRK